MKQYRGCSKLYYATVTEATTGGITTITYGTPTPVAPVKTVSRDITAESEKIFADNIVQEQNYGATTVTRTFSCVRIDPAVEATLLGLTEATFGTTRKAFGTPASGASRPYLAFGYALHDGDPDAPCELVWAFRGKVNSITKSANTIDDGTGSEGQDIEVEFSAPTVAFEETEKRELDISIPTSAATATTDVTKWFTQVVTFDNLNTVFA